MSVEHGAPKKVDVRKIESELEAMRRASGKEESVERALSHSFTIVIYSERDEPSHELAQLIGEVITRNPARAIVIRPEPDHPDEALEAFVSMHWLSRGEDHQKLGCELIWLNAHGRAVEQLYSTVLSLRLRDLPFVIWWRGQPDFSIMLFEELAREGDQIIFDSTRFTARAEFVNRLIARLRREFSDTSFGDINWARLAPWRELVAQFFDAPGNVEYLTQLREVHIEYAAGEGGNASQAILLIAWLAAQLNWQVVQGSYQRHGQDRRLQMRQDGHDILIHIRGVEQTDLSAGSLVSIALRADGEPPAHFKIAAGSDCATIEIKRGHKATVRNASFEIPDEVSLICSELDSPHLDRIYHRALELLEELLAQ